MCIQYQKYKVLVAIVLNENPVLIIGWIKFLFILDSLLKRGSSL